MKRRNFLKNVGVIELPTTLPFTVNIKVNIYRNVFVNESHVVGYNDGEIFVGINDCIGVSITNLNPEYLKNKYNYNPKLDFIVEDNVVVNDLIVRR